MYKYKEHGEEVPMAKIDWKDADGTAASVERLDGRYGPTFVVVFTYKVDDEWYGGTFSGSEEYRVGDSLSVRYDPKNPEHNDLVDKEAHKRWLIVGFFVILGIVVLVCLFF